MLGPRRLVCSAADPLVLRKGDRAVYERLEQLAFHCATRVCAPFLLIGLVSMTALADDAPRALTGGGLSALMACLALIGLAKADAGRSQPSANGESRESLTVALHASLFAASFFLAALGMAFALGLQTGAIPS